MTKEEAKLLKKGDFVSIIFEVSSQRSGGILDDDDDLRLYPIDDRGKVVASNSRIFNAKYLRKAENTISRFREGDIVMTPPGKIFFVKSIDQTGDVFIDDLEDSCSSVYWDKDELTLICPVEDRTDRKEDA